jgi:lipoprotein-releasing system permease protein
MALVIAMGLLSGYRTEVEGKLIGAGAEVVVFPLTAGGIAKPEELASRVRRETHVVAAAPVIYWQGTASSERQGGGATAVIKGVDRGSAREAPTGTGEGIPACSIGVELSRRLEAKVGDAIVLTVPDAARRGSGFALRRRSFRVSKIFQTNFFEYDSEWVFVDRSEARSLAGLSAGANVMEIRLDSPANVETATPAIRRLAGDAFSVTDWRSMNGALFSALAIQKTTLFLVIGLIVAVSTFNIAATLLMNVQEKKRDIGILSACGAPPALSRAVFLKLGLLIGATGVALGLAAGTAVCVLITQFRLVHFPPEVAEIYFVSFVPFLVRLPDLAAITGFSFAVIAAASYLPARQAARLPIAEALRYE